MKSNVLDVISTAVSVSELVVVGIVSTLVYQWTKRRDKLDVRRHVWSEIQSHNAILLENECLLRLNEKIVYADTIYDDELPEMFFCFF